MLLWPHTGPPCAKENVETLTLTDYVYQAQYRGNCDSMLDPNTTLIVHCALLLGYHAALVHAITTQGRTP